jgi:hypothetical protein
LLLITVGMGYSGFYSPTADILAERFTVVSYDRTLQLSQQRGSNY